jgi:hypothetical protein
MHGGVDSLARSLGCLARHRLCGLRRPRVGPSPAPSHGAQVGPEAGAVRLPGRHGAPLLGCTHHIAGPLGLGAASHRDRVEPPRPHAIARHGVQHSLLRLHAYLLEPTPLLEHPEKSFALPPTARPLHHQAGTRDIRHGQTREQEPVTRLLVATWSALLRRHGDDLNGEQRASWPAGASARHPFDGQVAGGLSRSPVGLTRPLHREGARRARLRPLLPEGTRGGDRCRSVDGPWPG